MKRAVVCQIRSNFRWEADLTYVFDGTQLNYLFTVTDGHDKEIMGDQYELRCRFQEAPAILDHAISCRLFVRTYSRGRARHTAD